MANTLVIFAHPYPHKSRANKTILQHLRGLPGVTICDLYEKYPYFHIDVAAEQALLEKNQPIVIQFPIYWYSVPPLLKLWFDEVLEYGYAYGPGGDKLKGKKLQFVFTTGGAKESYSPEGFHQHNIEIFFAPWIQTARLCQMQWQPPLILNNAGKAEQAQLDRHGELVRQKIFSLGAEL